MYKVGMRLSCNFVNMYTKLVNDLLNVYTDMADDNKMQMVLSWFSDMITISRLVTAAAGCNVS